MRLGFLQELMLMAAVFAAGMGCVPQERIEIKGPPVIARQHIAWVQYTNERKASVVLDGTLLPGEYDKIENIVLSPVGERIAYPAQRGGTWRMVLDGGEIGPACDEICPSCTAFSPDGRRLAFGARIKERWYVVMDGKALPPPGHAYVGSFAFSPDGRRFVYAAGEGSRQALVENGRSGPSFDIIREPVFSRDSRRLAYLGARGALRYVVVDGALQTPWEAAEHPVWSLDGEHLAYAARKGGKSFVIKDGRRIGGEYPMETTIAPIMFGPADSRVAFAAFDGLGWIAVIDGVEGPRFIDILASSITLSPDGRGFAFQAANGAGWFIMRDGRTGPNWDSIVLGSRPFSPDGRRFVYAGQRNGQWRVVKDGEEGPPLEYNELGADGGPNWSPDGGYIVYTARQGKQWRVVVNGRAGPPYDRVYRPAFKENGVAFLAERESDGWLLRCRQPYPREGGASPVDVEEEKVSRLLKIEITPEECVPCKQQRRLLQSGEGE